MNRMLLAFTAMVAMLAPSALAQGVTVCVFQGKDAKGVNADIANDVTALARELVPLTLPGGATLNVVPVTGVDPKTIDAEAKTRNCTDVVTIWRQAGIQDTPNYGGTLGGTQASQGSGNMLMLKDTKLQNGDLLEYSVRKPDSKKAIAHGESDSTSYGSFANAIVKKIAK
jgi:hypothetical protein